MSNRSAGQPRRWSRRGPLAVLAGCGPSADASTATAGTRATAATGERATITVTPADGTRKAGFTSPVEVGASPGTLASVQVTGNDGSTLAGTFNAARTKWTSSRNPCSGTKYTVTARAEGAGDAHVTSFTTKTPGATFVGCFTPEARSTSGAGMPVSVTFTHEVTDRAAVQKAITVLGRPAGGQRALSRV